MKPLFISLIFSIFCFSCSTSSNQPSLNEWAKSPRVRVLSTTAMIGDVVKEIGGDEVSSLVLIHGQLDPHSYQLVKGDLEKFTFADLVFYNGLGLEDGASLKNILREAKQAVNVGAFVKSHLPEKILQVDGVDDPHIWMDVSLWREMTFVVEKSLIEKRPDLKKTFEKNAKILRKNLSELHDHLMNTLQAIPEEKRYVITSHDAFSYFAKTYLSSASEEVWQERFQAPIGLAPDGKLSLEDIEKMVLHSKKHQISVIFSESNVSKDSLRKIVQSAKAKGHVIAIAPEALYGDAMGPFDYFSMMNHNAKMLRKYLK